MPGRTTRNGYGTKHQKLRAAWAPIVAAGRVKCWRCGQLIEPGEPWDLGHDDATKRRYRGPEHRQRRPGCIGNRGAGWAKIGKRAKAQRLRDQQRQAQRLQRW